MDITPLIPKGKQILTGYGGGGFKVNNEFVSGSVLLLPDRVIPWQATAPIEQSMLQPLLRELTDIDVLLIGTGKDMASIPAEFRDQLKQRSIALEAMATGAASRTYNILLSDERRVAAALIAV